MNENTDESFDSVERDYQRPTTGHLNRRRMSQLRVGNDFTDNVSINWAQKALHDDLASAELSNREKAICWSRQQRLSCQNSFDCR